MVKTSNSMLIPFLGSDGGLRKNLYMARFYSMKWFTTGVGFATVGVIAGLYVTDWKVIVEKIPFYRNQFKE